MNKLYIILLVISAIIMIEMASVMLGQSARIEILKNETKEQNKTIEYYKTKYEKEEK